MLLFTLKVVEIRKETSDTVTLCLKQPGLKKIKYLPGQYLTLIFRINGRRYIRPYSFSSAPGVDTHLEVTIKRIQGGVVSNHVNDFIKIDDLIEVMSPMGDFILDDQKLTDENHIVLWGAGSGVTPLISIAKYALHSDSKVKVSLIYGNRNHESIIFKDKIIELERLFPEKFKTWHFHTQLKIPVKNDRIIEGRISPERVFGILKEQTDLKHSIHFICGPTGLKESIKRALKDFDVNEENIFTEEFEIIKSPEDFKNISTRFVEIVKDGKVNKIEVIKGKSILEAGLDALIDLDYSCQTGSCTLCKAKILSGNIKTIGVSLASDAIKDGECLLCCCYPMSDNITLSVL